LFRVINTYGYIINLKVDKVEKIVSVETEAKYNRKENDCIEKYFPSSGHKTT